MPDPLTKIDSFMKQANDSENTDKDLKKILQHLQKTYQRVSKSTTAQWIVR